MYFKRKIDEYLLGWKEDPAHKPLIVKGARQIGKTESIMHFAKANYANIIYVVCTCAFYSYSNGIIL